MINIEKVKITVVSEPRGYVTLKESHVLLKKGSLSISWISQPACCRLATAAGKSGIFLGGGVTGFPSSFRRSFFRSRSMSILYRKSNGGRFSDTLATFLNHGDCVSPWLHGY